MRDPRPTPSKPLLVGMGDFLVTRDPGARLDSCAIGSCLAVAAHDARAGVAGILHFILPNSQLNPSMALIQPRMFADTGLRSFWEEMAAQGARPEDTTVRLIGGATVVQDLGSHDIGGANVQTARRWLEDRGFTIRAEDTGGRVIRSFTLEMPDGRVRVRCQGSEKEI